MILTLDCSNKKHAINQTASFIASVKFIAQNRKGKTHKLDVIE